MFRADRACGDNAAGAQWSKSDSRSRWFSAGEQRFHARGVSPHSLRRFVARFHFQHAGKRGRRPAQGVFRREQASKAETFHAGIMFLPKLLTRALLHDGEADWIGVGIAAAIVNRLRIRMERNLPTRSPAARTPVKIG